MRFISGSFLRGWKLMDKYQMKRTEVKNKCIWTYVILLRLHYAKHPSWKTLFTAHHRRAMSRPLDVIRPDNSASCLVTWFTSWSAFTARGFLNPVAIRRHLLQANYEVAKLYCLCQQHYFFRSAGWPHMGTVTLCTAERIVSKSNKQLRYSDWRKACVGTVHTTLSMLSLLSHTCHRGHLQISSHTLGLASLLPDYYGKKTGCCGHKPMELSSPFSQS